MNTQNFGVLTGRLAATPRKFMNKDGSAKMAVTIAVKRNYKEANGKYPTDFLDLQGFVKEADKKSVYDYLEKGSMVQIHYSLKRNVYTRNDTTVYEQVAVIENITLLPSAKKADMIETNP